MAFKTFVLNDNQVIKIYKRKKSRHLRLSIGGNGEVKVSIPYWAPYKAGIDFARSKEAWINSNFRKKTVLSQNQAIGKAHRLYFKADPLRAKPSSRISNNLVTVSHSPLASFDDEDIQKVASKASIRALRKQAESLLPQRLEVLANQFNFKYKNVSIKNLKSRWGSCDQEANIVLNLYLMQLPWELIDYVLLHELTHTQILRHGPDFWQSMDRILPNTKSLKKQLRSYQPAINSSL
jgi:predicted metal-dependent hydrolase